MTVHDKLDSQQLIKVQQILQIGNAALFAEQGTGKTWIAGGVVEALIEQFRNHFTGLFVVRLGNKVSTWEAFFKEHLPRVRIAHSLRTLHYVSEPRVLLLHYQQLPDIVEKLRKRLWTLICYDEAHDLKDRASLNSRTANKLRNSAVQKLIMTGTPQDKTPGDLWAQFRFLEPAVLGERWADFEQEFFEPLTNRVKYLQEQLEEAAPGSTRWRQLMIDKAIAGKQRKFDARKLPLFLDTIRPHAIYMNSDHLNLPPLEVVPVPVVMRGEQRRLYDEIEQDCVASDLELTTPLKVTQIVKLHQICGGHVIDDDGITHTVGRAKLRAALNIIDNHHRDTPVVVFCRYTQEIAQLKQEIMERFKVRTEVLTGKTPKKQRGPLLKSFQAGELGVLICQTKTGGTGVDLFRSCVGIVYSYSHSLIDFEQLKKRLHRRGQTRPVKLYRLFATNSVDETINSVIAGKRKLSFRVLTNLIKESIKCRRK